MTINLKAPELRELKPRIMVCGVGGAGGNAVNNMIVSGLIGVDFIVANTDAQALTASKAERIIQMGLQVTEGLGAGSQPEVGRAAAEEALEEIRDHLAGAHMVFVTAGMGGGTGTGAAPVIARIARDMGILTVGVVTKPFQFEGQRRMRIADAGIAELHKAVDTLITIPNQNLFRIANEKTTFADAFSMADQVLYSGVACITDLMVKEGLINLDFADVRAIMREMGKAMMGTGEASGDKRAILAAEAAIANPLLDEVSMKGARGLLISITGGNDLTLYEVDEAASRIRQEVDEDANIILGATFDESLDGIVRVSVVATGIDQPLGGRDLNTAEARIAEAANRLRAQSQQPRLEAPAPTARYAVAPPEAYAPAPTPAPVYEEPAPAPQQHHYQPAPVASAAGVQLQQVAPPAAPTYAEPPRPAVREPERYDAGPFIPPAAEQPSIRQQRMPQIEDLPMPVQNQIRQQHYAATTDSQADVKRRTLLERLAAFGMSRDEVAPTAAPEPRQAPQLGYQPAPQRPQPSPTHADYAKRPPAPMPAHRQADPHGRPVAPTRQSEDDQLEIPAFLRRQTS
ncbi:cell division protein FtsZ [Beijerinckia sp. L45]|uniref:cell division protein FtsZ n=1 Tax=Beijerinckia sp. L45 TaxID=1641855 RepID=UPI00131E1D25|nr:cell division protein FtsZ [Beijerinckia sp. L45]